MRVMILTGFIFGFALGLVDGIAQESDAPFLYYYSPQDQAIVIERADGTERRLLAEGATLPSDSIYTFWISTGEWLVVRSLVDDYDEEVFVVRYDGEVVIEDLGNVAYLAWSPVDNYYIRHTASSETRFEVVNLETQEILLEFQSDGHPKWSGNGRYIYYLESPNKVVILGLDGSQIERQTFLDPDYVDSSFDFGSTMIYRHPQRETLVMENIDDGTVVEFPEKMIAFFQTTWSPNGEYALIYTMNDEARSDRCCVWLLSVQEERLDFLDFTKGGFGDYWADDSSWFAVKGNDYETWWQIDVNTLEKEQLTNPQPIYRGQSPLQSSDYQISPSGNYAASVPCNTHQLPSGKCIISLQQNQTIYLPVHDEVHSPVEGGVANWHRREDWVIFEEYTIGERMSDRYPHTSVAHPIGIYNEFTNCPRWFCPRWLPENVPID